MKFRWFYLLSLLVASPSLWAEQMQQLGPWQVHYSAFRSTFLTPHVASQYGLERSRYQGVINIAVQDKHGKAQAVGIVGEAKNLTGTLRPLEFKEVKEGEAIYYLASLPYRNEDTFQISVQLMGQGLQQKLVFQQTFYVDQ